jgi:PAS domain-containing protein
MEARCRSITEDLLDATDIEAIILDSNFEIAWCNETTADFFGIDPAAVIGRDRRRVLEDIGDIVADSGTFTGAILAAYEDNTYTEQFECHVPPGTSVRSDGSYTGATRSRPDTTRVAGSSITSILPASPSSTARRLLARTLGATSGDWGDTRGVPSCSGR